MARKLKVYGGNTHKPGHGQVRCVVAATSWRRVAELTGLPLHYLRGYWSETWNDAEVAAATTQPETLLYYDINKPGKVRIEVEE